MSGVGFDWKDCQSHGLACSTGFILAVVIVIVILVIAMYRGYTVSKPPTVMVAAVPPSAVPAVANAVANAHPAATASGKECFATPYDLDPATAELLKYRMASDPLVSRRVMRGKEHMSGSESSALMSALGGGGARI
jgi:hypothetical protein